MRDRIMNYATGAFREYASLQMPDYREMLEQMGKKGQDDGDMALLLDVFAVEKTLKYFDEVNPMISDAVREVYFSLPSSPFTDRVAAGRVRFFSASRNVSERSIYRWLRQAREVFAKNRGLRI